MSNLLIPIVLFCVFNSDTAYKCDNLHAVDKHVLEPVSTPMECLREGNIDATKTISDYVQQYPAKNLDYRILCKSNTKV